MRRLPVTVPAIALLRIDDLPGADGTQRQRVDICRMAANAILLHRLLPGLLNLDHLRLQAQGEHVSVAHPVTGLEKVFVEYIILRNMAIVTGGHPPVASSFPGGILRDHHMAVNTGFRVIRKIGHRIGNIGDMRQQSTDDPQEDDHRNLPAGGRFQLIQYTGTVGGHGGGFHIGLKVICRILIYDKK